MDNESLRIRVLELAAQLVKINSELHLNSQETSSSDEQARWLLMSLITSMMTNIAAADIVTVPATKKNHSITTTACNVYWDGKTGTEHHEIRYVSRTSPEAFEWRQSNFHRLLELPE